MNDLAYFQYNLILPAERYLIEVNTRNQHNGCLHREQEIEEIARECLALAFGERPENLNLKANAISESTAKVFKKVKEVLKRPDSIVYRVE